jgi:23S rRNA (pseudouridine1915-N3)-methyltransferase
MRVLIAAIGKAKAGPEQQLYSEYAKRLPWKIECREFVSKAQTPQQRIEQESSQLLAACKGYDRLIALDEAGKLLGSREFAGQLGSWQQQGASSFAFIIGGSDGLSTEALKQANLVWSLGKVTWPHMLVRALLAEQIYRAYSVLANHPYHREG